MKKRVWILLLLFGGRCILGWLSLHNFIPGEKIRVVGYPDSLYQDNSKCVISLERFKIPMEEICARFRGSKLEVIGNIDKRVIDGFDGKLWLVNAKIEKLDKTQEIKNSRIQDVDYINNFRDGLVTIYKKFVPEPEAGLTAGVVLGYKNDIGPEMYRQMVRSGSIHIAVASGYNILLVGGVVLSLCFWLIRRSIAVWIALAAMILYALLAGGDPPVVRAVWMAGLMYWGQVLGRGSVSVWILTVTAWVMLMIDPSLLSGASFQLSVAASYGMMVVEPFVSMKMERMMGGRMIEFAKSIGIMTTASTMVMTVPIIWWHFGRLSLFGIVSNILILPFIPPLMILGAGMLVLPWIFSWPVYALAHWLVLVIRFFGS